MEDLSTTSHHKHFIEESPENFYSYDHLKKCIICDKDIPYGSAHFHCRDCDFRFHKGCPTTFLESNQTIYRPETHQHTLTFIRKMNIFNCDACGEVYKDKMNMYGCLTCCFFVHRDCIYLPKVIKLTRHQHRLFHTFQVLDGKTNCRICNRRFVYEYGGYVCIDKTCDYKLHSHCATHKKVWDGKDAQGEHDDEMSTSEDVASSSSLVELDGKISHHHDLMRLCVNNEVEDGRVCQACVLPIDFGTFLGCVECNFALHDTCASLPRKMEHLFHRHPLTLEVNIEDGFFTCSICERESCGFMYRCNEKDCEFKMDAKCASLVDSLYIEAHQHPLTLLHAFASYYADCNECRFGLKLESVILPMLVKSKHDSHPLTICFSKTIQGYKLPWCEICEETINQEYPVYEDLYGCTECNTTVHVECAIGKYPYLKPRHTIKVNGLEIETASNSFSRPVCHACHSICQDKLVFKNKRDSVFLCSIKCITSLSKTLSAKTN